MYQKILLVVEANRARHVALDRAVATLALNPSQASVKVLVTVDAESSDTLAENPAIYRSRDWFEELTRPLDLIRLDYELVVSWSTQYAQSILYTARQFGASIIGVPTSPEVTDPELAMVRDTPCPVMFIRPGGSPAQRRIVLVAARPLQDDRGEWQFSETLLEAARSVAGKHEAELHLVTVGSRGNETAKLPGDIPGDRIHSLTGRPDAAIGGLAEELGADLVVLGSRQRQGQSALRGGIIDRLIGNLDVDLLIAP